MKTLITGGVKSGKSAFALQLAMAFPEPRVFLATAEALDEEMTQRISRHKDERGSRFQTKEVPIEVDTVKATSLLFDCVTMWVSNLFQYDRVSEFDAILKRFLATLPENAAIVTNEVGFGNIPMDPVARSYNGLLAKANNRIAAAVDRVVILVAGIPVVIKGPAL